MVDSLEQDEAPAPAKASKMPLVMAVCAAATVGAAGGMYAMLKRSPAAVGAAAGSHAEAAEAEGEDGPVVTMSPFVVNLTDETGEPHYLKCTLAVELANAHLDKVFEARTPKTRNAVLMYLSALHVDDTAGVDNKKKMLEGLRQQVQDVIGKHAVRDVYLTEFVIQ